MVLTRGEYAGVKSNSCCLLVINKARRIQSLLLVRAQLRPAQNFTKIRSYRLSYLADKNRLISKRNLFRRYAMAEVVVAYNRAPCGKLHAELSVSVLCLGN